MGTVEPAADGLCPAQDRALSETPQRTTPWRETTDEVPHDMRQAPGLTKANDRREP